MGRSSSGALVVLAVLAALAALPAGAGARGFSFGVTAGEVTPDSAVVWTRADQPGSYRAQIARDSRFHRIVAETAVSASATADNTMRVAVSRLRSNTMYFYRYLQGSKKSDTGRLRTAPAPNENATIRFAWSADQDAQRVPGQSQPYFGNFGVFAAMAREGNAFNVNLGDTIYSDTEVPSTPNGPPIGGTGFVPAAPPALSVAAKWAKYRQNLAMGNLQRLRSATGLYNHWDDHEFVNDFSRNETLTARDTAGNTVNVPGGPLYSPSVKAFRDYNPVTFSSRTGIYRSVRWGRNLELFFLDERSFRSAKASANGTCDNPQTGQPDFAPTAPSDIRTKFVPIVPSLAAPVSQQCLSTINDPNRTMLGARQLSTFENAIKRSKATFKVVMNEVPIQQLYANPYDRWEGYAAERAQLLTFLRSNVKNVIFLSTDVHASLVNDARFKTFPSEGGPSNSGILDVTTGPVATGTFKREINRALGQDADSGASAGLADGIFFTHQPTDPGFPGVGMQCSVIDTFSYGEATVTNKKLTIQLKDANRQPIREEEGTNPPCPAIVLNKR